MTTAAALSERVGTSLDRLDSVIGRATAADLARTPSGKRSALDNLAHVARHQDLFTDRLLTIVQQAEPLMTPYAAETDPDWPRWRAMAMEQVVIRLRDDRAALARWIGELPDEAFGRRGVHGRLGPMSLLEWIDFFLLHSDHHLFVAMKRVRGGE